MTLADLTHGEISRRVKMAASRKYNAEELQAFRIGLMVGGRAPEFGAQLEEHLAGINGVPAEMMEQHIRTIADILLAPFEPPAAAEEGLGGA